MYRDELTAAQSRVAALESQLKALRATGKDRLKCGQCGQALSFEHFDRELTRMTCPQCSAVVELSHRRAQTLCARGERGILRVTESHASALKFSAAGVGLLVCSQISGMLVFMVLGAVLGMTLFATGIILALHAQEVVASETMLSVRGRHFRVEDIDQLYCTALQRNRRQILLWLRLKNGDDYSLAVFSNLSEALTAEMQIEAHLQIPDRTVAEEIPTTAKPVYRPAT